MSRTRDTQNLDAMRRMLGGHPPHEHHQPLTIAAAGAGGGAGGGGLAIWTDEIAVAGAPYYLTGSGWSSLTSAVGERHTVGVCIAAVAAEGETPASSTIVVGGEFSRTGTAGAPVYADAAGALSETFPGDETDTTTSAPWVWAIAWQISDTRAILQQVDPYRPRALTYCLADGVTQLVLTVREYPPDPA